MAQDPRERAQITINDIARLASVSKKTVSRVINDSPLVRGETRDRVLAVIATHQFRPNPQARALASRTSFLVGLVYDNPSPQYVVSLQRGILDELDATSFQLVLRPGDRADPQFRERVQDFVHQHKPRGLILPPSVSEDEGLVEALRDMGCAYVRIASVMLDAPERMIRTEDARGAELAANHLAALGHRRIAHIHGPNSFRSTHERLAGFRRGLAAAGINLARADIAEGAYTFESGEARADELLRRADRPTAIFAGNDEMAVGVQVAARKVGLSIPQDVSIVGYDDTPIAARVWPPMTTIRVPIREMGRAAARRLLDRDGDGPSSVSFAPELVIRESAAPPR